MKAGIVTIFFIFYDNFINEIEKIKLNCGINLVYNNYLRFKLEESKSLIQ